MADPKTTADDVWKQTVRDIFDLLHFGNRSVFNDECAREVVDLIEERHHDYFCLGKAMKEWNSER